MSLHEPSEPTRPLAIAASLDAAAVVVLAARWLPLSFTWRPNDLGIVSATTVARHPTQAETLWFALCVALGLGAAWALCAWHARRAWRPAGLLAVEALAAALLASVLLLERGPATAAGLALAAVQVALTLREPRRAPAPSPAAEAASPPRALAGAGAWGAALAVAALRVPGLFVAARLVAGGVPDERLVRAGWSFDVETGQHLAWADALARGALHGRDIFCLYGPLYDWSIVAAWEVLGRSIRATYLAFGLSELAGGVAMVLLASELVRRRALWAIAPLLTVLLNLRIGLPFLGLYALSRRFRGGGGAWAAAAGLAGGGALLYSQEFGLAFFVCAATALGLRRSLPDALAFAGGATAAVAPVLVAYAWAGALLPMLSDLAAYPGWVMAGYGNQPFPSLVAALPLRPALPGPGDAPVLGLGVFAAAACAAALAATLPRSGLWQGSVTASLRRVADGLRDDPHRLVLLLVAAFGLLAFRSALGRSDLVHVLNVLPPASLIAVVAVDRILDGWGRDARARALAIGRLAWLGAVLGLCGYGMVLGTSGPHVRQSVAQIRDALAGESPQPAGNPRVNRVVRWVRRHTGPTDPIWSIPNNAAYYYLADRRNPTRFALAHQLVTEAHREEVLADLKRDPPRAVLWDDAARRLDGLSDETVLGEAVMDWLEASYVLERRFGPLRVLVPADRFRARPGDGALEGGVTAPGPGAAAPAAPAGPRSR